MTKNIRQPGKVLEPTLVKESVPFPIYDGGLRFFEQTRRILCWPDEVHSDLVVDVGCGHAPFPFANTLVDKTVEDHGERFGLPIPRDGRRILEADLEKGLPFSENEVGFLYCSHVLEHCDDPARACREIIRVARAGFIETPAVIFELLMGGPTTSHKWVTEFRSQGQTLVFRRLTDLEQLAIERRMALGNILGKLMEDPVKSPRRHMIAYWKNQEMFTHCFLWKGAFEFEVGM